MMFTSDVFCILVLDWIACVFLGTYENGHYIQFQMLFFLIHKQMTVFVFTETQASKSTLFNNNDIKINGYEKYTVFWIKMRVRINFWPLSKDIDRINTKCKDIIEINEVNY